MSVCRAGAALVAVPWQQPASPVFIVQAVLSAVHAALSLPAQALESPAWTAKANATITRDRMSFFIGLLILVFWRNSSVFCDFWCFSFGNKSDIIPFHPRDRLRYEEDTFDYFVE